MRRILISLVGALAGLLGSGAAHAHGPAWSVTIGSGGFGGVSIGLPGVVVAPRVVHGHPGAYPYARAYVPAPYYAAPVVYAPPVQVIPMHPRGHRHRHHDHHGPRGYWRGY